MGYRVEMKLNSNVAKQMLKLRNAIVPAGQVTVDKMAEQFHRDVIKLYKEGGVQKRPYAKGTIQKYLQGKRAGSTPAKPAKLGAKPLGSLYKLVELKKRKTSRGANNRIYIRAGVPMSGGGLSEMVAKINEFGSTHTVVASTRARTYLRALAMGVAGTGVLVRPVNAKPLLITIKIPPRPVWQPAFVRMLSRQPKEFAHTLVKELKAKTGIHIELQGV